MATGILGIGMSGLAAAHAGLVTTGHNIANANTPGFHRQEIQQSNRLPLPSGWGFIGQGAQIDSVRRVYSSFLEMQASAAHAQSSYYTTQSEYVGQVDSLMSDPSAGLSPVLQNFFQAVHELAANPGSAPTRQALVSASQVLSSRFQSLNTRLGEIERGINAQIESTVLSANVYTREIAAMNAKIGAATVSAHQPPNDLLDQRDRLITELNKLVGVRTIDTGNGLVDVSLSTGQTLVASTQSFALAAVRSNEVAGRVDVGYVTGSTTVIIPRQGVNGGQLGAMLDFRAGALPDAQNQLGLIAAGLAESFNAQHRLGQDITGVLGGDFFVPPQPEVTASAANSGTAVLSASIASAAALEASDYSLTYNAGAYQLTRLSDNSVTTFGTLPQTVDGLTIQLTGGAPANGDTFTIQATRNAAREFALAFNDPRLIASAAPIRTGSSNANMGSGAISAGIVNPPLNANLQQPVTITFTSPTTFNVTGVGTGNPVGLAYTPGANITYNGWTVSISGAPMAGDSFTVSSNVNGVADNRNAALLAELRTTPTLNGGTETFQSAYGNLSTTIGNTAREMKISADAQATVAQRTRSAQQAVSGVNLDEEAANLVRYQQAYQASGKVIQIATVVFDTLLDIGR